MFDKKDDNTNSSPDVFRPAKGSAKVVIGQGVVINGEIKKADEVQIDGEVDVTMKTDNLVVGATGDCKGAIETHNADIWGAFDGDIKASGTLTIQEQGKVSGKNEYQTRDSNGCNRLYRQIRSERVSCEGPTRHLISTKFFPRNIRS